MGNNINTDKETCVVVITQKQDTLCGIMLRRENGVLQIAKTKCSDVRNTNLELFAADFGLSNDSPTSIAAGGSRKTVIGFDSRWIIFKQFSIPAVKKEEVAGLIRLQAEALLPLPVEQMEIGWRLGEVKNGKMSVTIAASKKDILLNFAGNLRTVRPAKVLLNTEGIVKVWKALFMPRADTAVIVSVSSRNTEFCLIEDGQMCNAISLDTGIDDILIAEAGSERSLVLARFTQDIRSVLELFGYSEPSNIRVFMLSDGRTAIKELVGAFDSLGLNAQEATPDLGDLALGAELTAADIYEYRVPLGLGLMVLDGEDTINLFENLYQPAHREIRRHWFYSPRLTGAIAAIMLLVLTIVFYAADVGSLRVFEKSLKSSDMRTDFRGLMERRELVKKIAVQRPDILELLGEINTTDSKNILLDSFEFRMGQPVSISGQAPDTEQLYKFQESLQDKKGIRNVKIQSAAEDSKIKKLRFNMTFDYKVFSGSKLSE